MSDQSRQFPRQPSLRYLKLEAKRRLAAGEFSTLHDAQLAIAREHGLSSWTMLKQHVESQTESQPALPPTRSIRSAGSSPGSRRPTGTCSGSPGAGVGCCPRNWRPRRSGRS
jgi:hypothetical protein